MRFIFLLSIFSLNIFILLSAYFKQVLAIDIGNLYYPFIVLLTSLNFIYFSYMLWKYKKFKKTILLLFLFSLILTVSFILSPYNNHQLVQINYILYIIWSLPAGLVGVYVSDYKKEDFEKYMRVIFFIFSFFLIFTILVPYLKGKLELPISIGLMNYQNTSYITAFTIGIGIYFSTKTKVKERIIYFAISLLLVPIVIISAGRGGALLLIIYVMIALIQIYFSKNIHVFHKILLIMCIVVASIAFINLAAIIDKDGRMFSYITEDGISLEKGSSGRDVVYEMDIKAIEEKPLLGYGFFNYYHHTFSVPHNIVLEIILIGGYVLLSFTIIFSIYLILKMIKVWNTTKPDRLVLYIFIYPITLLMFSTNFLIVPEFWFAVFYMLSRSNKYKVIEVNEGECF